MQGNAQSDTTIHFYNNIWKECAKDTAVYISNVFAADNVWQQKDYWVKNMQLQMEATWLDAKCTKPTGTTTWYNEKGVATLLHDYENGTVARKIYFYDNGNKKVVLEYILGHLAQQTGWDSSGNEIPNFVYEREACFPGGAEGWKEFLETRIDINTAARSRAPKGVYTVKVQFIVNKEGEIERTKAVSVPSQCALCGEEAVKIINSSPKWEHAIQNGRPVIYQAIQYISWEVTD